MAGAATSVNVVTGALAVVALRWLNVKSMPMRYFLWLFASISFVMGTWNMVTLPLLGAGDWEDLAVGLDNAGLWAAGVVAAGVVVAIVGYRLPLRLFMSDLGDHPGLRHKIVLVPLSTIVVVQTLSVAFSPFATAPPESNHLLASVFAYAHLAVWALLVNRGVGPRSTRPAGDIALNRSTGWLVGGLVIVMVFIAVLGPGIGPLEDHPLLDSS